MFQFPGEDHVLFVQDVPFKTIERYFKLTGAPIRLLYRDRYSDERFRMVMAQIFRTPWARIEFEVAREVGALMEVYTNRGRFDYPIWVLGKDRGSDLRKLTSAYDCVFIKNSIPSKEYAVTAPSGPRRFMLRELWEINRENPGKLIIYDGFNYQLYWMYGLPGCAIRRGAFVGPSRISFFTPDGRVHRRRDLEAVLAEWPIPDGIKSRPSLISLYYASQTPEWVEKFYSNVERFDLEAESDFAGVLAEIRKNRASKYFISPPGCKRGRSYWTTRGDLNLCDHCAVAPACKLYKEGSVCVLTPESSNLAKLIGGRNSADVIKGIGELLQGRVARYEEALNDERHKRAESLGKGKAPKQNPRIDKMGIDIQRDAIAYAKLLNPRLASPKLSLEITNGEQKEIEFTNPEIAQGARELEALGTPRGEISDIMIYEHLRRKAHPAAIESREENRPF